MLLSATSYLQESREKAPHLRTQGRLAAVPPGWEETQGSQGCWQLLLSTDWALSPGSARHLWLLQQTNPQCCGELREPDLGMAISTKAALSPSPPVHPAPDLCGPLEMKSAAWSRAHSHSAWVRILALPPASFIPLGVLRSLSEPEF